LTTEILTREAPRAGVVSVGDELLLGETVDTNGAWLSRQLSRAGFLVRVRWVVGDTPEKIQEAVGSALAQAEVVVVTGGLGPTPDDRTRKAVADLLHLPLRSDLHLLEALRERFRVRGYGSLPEGAEAMALVPQGATVLPNPHGAAPGLLMDGPKGNLCILLPGIPREMEGIVQQEALSHLADRYGPRLSPVVHRVIHTVGIPESVLQAQVEATLPDRLEGVSLAYLPEESGVRLRLSARGDAGEGAMGQERAHASLLEVERLLGPVVDPFRYRAESGDLAEAVGTALLEGNRRLAVAESCTGGLVAKRMTDIPGSSRYFLGGVVAYANQVKVDLLGLDPAVMEERGLVSREVAEGMAEGVARALGADAGMGITGIAGPEGGSKEKPVGTVWYSVWLEGRVETRRDLFLGDREAIRRRAAHGALGLLLRLLEGRQV